MENNTITNTKRYSTKSLVLIALITAITCILAPLSIPIPISPVPITLTNLVLLISVYLIGWKAGTISYLAYLLIGLVGIPVFSGFSGGIGKLAGPTGGYLIGFIFLTIIAGVFIERFHNKPFLIFIGMVLANIINYIFGTLWLSYQLDVGFIAGLSIGVFPYIIGDLVKCIIAMSIGPIISQRVASI
ncbi:MAG: biotin transporter BioY [Suipraeoptans sp.]